MGKKLQRFNKKIVMATTALVVATAAFVASVCYAWFSLTTQNKVDSMQASVVSDGLDFVKTINTVRHKEKEEDSEDQTTTTYVDIEQDYYIQDDGTISYTDENNNKITPSFADMIPGEYVDITIKFYAVDKSLANVGYKLSLTDFGTGTKNYFKIKKSGKEQETQYGVLGAFKYGIWTTNEETGELEAPADSALQYLRDFSDYENEGYTVDTEYKIEICAGTLGGVGEENAITVKFRIQLDFTAYYALLQNEGADYEDYLSGKILKIGTIMLEPVTTTEDDGGEATEE